MLLAAALILALAGRAPAIEITKYDQLSLEDKTRYVEMLLRGTERILRDLGKPGEAKRVGQLFSETPVGEQMPEGMKQFEKDLIAAELYQQRTGKTMHVEYALILTLKKLGIEIAKEDMMAFGKDFKPSTK
jgi:hypothetical protein